jgi:predicted RND superfamily exporter protein
MTVAIMSLIGFKIGMGFGSTPTLLTAIGVAHSVHILSEFRNRFLLGTGRRQALVETMTLVGVPCLLTTVTTAIGFASMSFVPIRSLAQGGVINSIGVVVAYAFSMTLLMSLLSIDWLWAWRKLRGIELEVPAGLSSPDSAGQIDTGAKGGAWMNSALDWVAQINVDHRGTLLIVFSLFLIVFGIGATRVEVDSNYLKDFWKSSRMYQDTVKVDSEMGGTTNVVYLFDAGEDDGVKNPEVLHEIDRLQQLANAEDWLVTKTYSIVDIVKDLNQSFHGDDPAYYAIPETREAVAQYLLLYESSGGEEAEEYVTSDYRRANLELRLKMDATAAMERLVAGLDGHLEDVPPKNSDVSLTGIGALWLVLMGYIVSSQVQGFTIAFSVITLVMIGVFRSFKIGVISMVPNLAPVFLALGAMGWFGITLDYTKATIAAIALGISVDDTIHLMTRFHHEFEKHRNYERALRASLSDVGRALMITSIALVLGFAALTFSEMRSQAFYGILLSSSLVAALVADFFFMPALVLKFKPFGPEGEGIGEVKAGRLAKAA